MNIITAVCLSYLAESTMGVHQHGHVYRLALIAKRLQGVYGAHSRNVSELGADELTPALGYVKGGAQVQGPTASVEHGRVVLSFTDALWPMASFTAVGGLLYNESAGGAALAVLQFPGEFIGNGGAFIVPLRAVISQCSE